MHFVFGMGMESILAELRGETHKACNIHTAMRGKAREGPSTMHQS